MVARPAQSANDARSPSLGARSHLHDGYRRYRPGGPGSRSPRNCRKRGREPFSWLHLSPTRSSDLQHDPLMSPILWDLGHIAHFEELWLTRNLDGPIEFVEMPGLYNPFEHPRSDAGPAGPSRPRSIAGTSWTRSADRCWATSPPRTSIRTIRCCTTASSTTWCSSTSTSTTRRCSRLSSSSRAGPTLPWRGWRLRRVGPPAMANRGRWCASPVGPWKWAPTIARRRTTTSGPGTS